MTAAAFKSYSPGISWSSTALDFSESGVSYDLNGNLTSLTRRGVQIGVTTAVLVDDLSYTYESFSNKLKSVADNSPLAANATTGDFKNNNTGNNDYTYDLNGNLLTDLNKGIKDLGGVAGAAGIKYNYLDKPDEINIPGKGTIKITYDADGAKLKREYIAATGGATKVTWYMGMYQ
jgi:hypothetical protein